jgi:hypothetical protein
MAQFSPVRHNYDFDIFFGALLCVVGTGVGVLVCIACVFLGRLQFGDQYDLVAQDASIIHQLRVVEGE